MIKQTIRLGFRLLMMGWLIYWLNACANPISPTGGPIDEQPPRVDSTQSTPNFQTNFDQDFFELTFDEWVVLEDILNQVVVSPPLDFEVTLKRRTVRFEVKEGDSLRDNTTYTVNFGEAVKDLTEKNPAEDLRFVFSTGSFLDSLSMSGQLFDIQKREPVEDAYFMLYDILADSVVRTQRPYYFARSDEQGFFTLSNLRAGTYKAFALKGSGPSGYLYTNIGSQIGFPDTNVVISPEQSPSLEIAMFEEERPLRYLNSENRVYGQLKLVFNQENFTGVETIIPDSLPLLYRSEIIKDTLKVWYDLQNVDTLDWQMRISKDTLVDDTITVRPISRSAFLNNRLLEPLNQSGGTSGINPQAPIVINWKHPIVQIDTSLIQLSKDSIPFDINLAEVDSLRGRTLSINAAFQQDSLYRLLILPGALTDFFGLINDSLLVDYKVGKLEDFGNITLQISELDSNLAYIGQLMQGEQIIDSFYIDQKSSFKYQKTILRPTKYVIKLIEDRNRNRKWDTGSYDLKRQAEPIYTKELEQLRANWDLEESVELSELIPVKFKPNLQNQNTNRQSNRRN